MMLDRKRRMVISLALASSIMALAAGLAWYALDAYGGHVDREKIFLRAEAEAQHALRNARDQLELAEQVSQRYRVLQNQGIFAAVDKPVAIDRAELTLRPYSAAVTRYQIGGGHEIAPSPLEPTSQYQIDIERFAVEFEPLHEERFLSVWRAIDSLRGPVGGVESCELHRPPELNPTELARREKERDSAPDPLKARCLLTWYRLQGTSPAQTDAAAAAAPAAPRGARS